MKSLVLVLALSMIPAFGFSQNAGFRVGIARPGAAVGAPAVQPPAFVPKSTFIPAPQIAIQQLGLPGAPGAPFYIQPPAVIVPQSPVIVPQSPVIVQQPPVFIPQAPVFVQPAPGFVQAPAFVPTVGPHVPVRIGMPRADVIRQYGAPAVTIITSSGEMLYFTGGVTVIIQNGQVIGPR